MTNEQAENFIVKNNHNCKVCFSLYSKMMEHGLYLDTNNPFANKLHKEMKEHIREKHSDQV